MQQIGTLVEHGLDGAEIVARAAAFHHVAGQRVRAAGKADQRHAAGQRTPDFADRIHHIAQLRIRIGHRQIADRPFVAQRPLELRTFAFGEVQAQAHRVGDGEDVGKQDRRIEFEARQRLQRHLAGQCRGSCTGRGNCRRGCASRCIPAGSGRPGASARRACIRSARAAARAARCRSWGGRVTGDSARNRNRKQAGIDPTFQSGCRLTCARTPASARPAG